MEAVMENPSTDKDIVADVAQMRRDMKDSARHSYERLIRSIIDGERVNPGEVHTWLDEIGLTEADLQRDIKLARDRREWREIVAGLPAAKAAADEQAVAVAELTSKHLSERKALFDRHVEERKAMTSARDAAAAAADRARRAAESLAASDGRFQSQAL